MIFKSSCLLTKILCMSISILLACTNTVLSQEAQIVPDKLAQETFMDNFKIYFDTVRNGVLGYEAEFIYMIYKTFEDISMTLFRGRDNRELPEAGDNVGEYVRFVNDLTDLVEEACEHGVYYYDVDLISKNDVKTIMQKRIIFYNREKPPYGYIQLHEETELTEGEKEYIRQRGFWIINRPSGQESGMYPARLKELMDVLYKFLFVPEKECTINKAQTAVGVFIEGISSDISEGIEWTREIDNIQASVVSALKAYLTEKGVSDHYRVIVLVQLASRIEEIATSKTPPARLLRPVSDGLADSGIDESI